MDEYDCDAAVRLCQEFQNVHPSVPWLVWPFHDAPIALQRLSKNGGDEDWIMVMSSSAYVPFWAEEGSSFGCCTVEEHVLPSGHRVLIGCHA